MENSRNYTDNLIRPSTTMLNPHKGTMDGLSSQLGGLLRYRSAPSSTFAALLEPDFCSPNDSAELVQFLTQSALCDFAGYGDAGLSLKPNHKQAINTKKGPPQQVYPGQNDTLLRHNGRGATCFQEHLGQGPLSAILEHAGEETCIPQPCQPNPTSCSPHEATVDSSGQDKSNLIRHNSLPIDFLLRLAMVEMSERHVVSQQMGSHMQSTSQEVGSHMQSTSQQLSSLISITR